MYMTHNKSIYLDNAASTFPKPKIVLKQVFDILNNNTSNPGRSGHFLSENAAQKIYDCRHIAADYFGNQDDAVLFTQNATYAVNTLFNGLLKEGDHVVISDMEHNCVLRPLVALENKGVTFSCFDTDLPPENMEDYLRPNTKLIFICHASNVTGHTIDIKTIAQIARQHKILFGIDASQSAGHIRYNMQQDNIDFICTSGHKSLFGLQGSGLFITRNDIEFPPLVYGGTGTESLNPWQPKILPEYYESGTLNTPAIVSLGTGIEFVKKHENEINKKIAVLITECHNLLSRIDGIRIYSGKNTEIPIVAFSYKNKHSEYIAEYLNKHKICVRAGYHCSALAHKKLNTTENGLVRVGMSYFNTLADIEKLCYYLGKLCFY